MKTQVLCRLMLEQLVGSRERLCGMLSGSDGIDAAFASGFGGGGDCCILRRVYVLLSAEVDDCLTVWLGSWHIWVERWEVWVETYSDHTLR